MVNNLLNRLQEAEESPFKPASKEEHKKRKEDNLKAMIAKGVPPVDDEAEDLSGQIWDLTVKLENRLSLLRDKYQVDRSNPKCKCDWEVFDALGEDPESHDIPGDNGYYDRFCLRCGGSVEV